MANRESKKPTQKQSAPILDARRALYKALDAAVDKYTKAVSADFADVIGVLLFYTNTTSFKWHTSGMADEWMQALQNTSDSFEKLVLERNTYINSLSAELERARGLKKGTLPKLSAKARRRNR